MHIPIQRTKKRSRDLSVWPQRVGDFYRCKWSQFFNGFNLFKRLTRNPNKRAQLSPNWNLEKVLKSQIFTLEDGNFRVIFHARIPYPLSSSSFVNSQAAKKYCAFVTCDLLFPIFPSILFPRASLVTIVNFTHFFSRTRNDLQNE